MCLYCYMSLTMKLLRVSFSVGHLVVQGPSNFFLAYCLVVSCVHVCWGGILYAWELRGFLNVHLQVWSGVHEPTARPAATPPCCPTSIVPLILVIHHCLEERERESVCVITIAAFVFVFFTLAWYVLYQVL